MTIVLICSGRTCLATCRHFVCACILRCVHLYLFKLLLQKNRASPLLLKFLLCVQDLLAAFLRPGSSIKTQPSSQLSWYEKRE
ncbi:hypothetical protein FKM82_007248 [Ascaphus truei]